MIITIGVYVSHLMPADSFWCSYFLDNNNKKKTAEKKTTKVQHRWSSVNKNTV